MREAERLDSRGLVLDSRQAQAGDEVVDQLGSLRRVQQLVSAPLIPAQAVVVEDLSALDSDRSWHPSLRQQRMEAVLDRLLWGMPSSSFVRNRTEGE